MNKLRTHHQGAGEKKRFLRIAWFVDVPFTVEVHERLQPQLAVSGEGVWALIRPPTGASGSIPTDPLPCSETPFRADISAPEAERSASELN